MDNLEYSRLIALAEAIVERPDEVEKLIEVVRESDSDPEFVELLEEIRVGLQADLPAENPLLEIAELALTFARRHDETGRLAANAFVSAVERRRETISGEASEELGERLSEAAG